LVPFADVTDWSEFSIVVNYADVDTVPQRYWPAGLDCRNGTGVAIALDDLRL
jgi:hypothetical protein